MKNARPVCPHSRRCSLLLPPASLAWDFASGTHIHKTLFAKWDCWGARKAATATAEEDGGPGHHHCSELTVYCRNCFCSSRFKSLRAFFFSFFLFSRLSTTSASCQASAAETLFWRCLLLLPLLPLQVIASWGAEDDGPSQRDVSGQGELGAGQQHGRGQGAAGQVAPTGAERQPTGPGPAVQQQRGQALRSAVQAWRPPAEDLPQERWARLTLTSGGIYFSSAVSVLRVLLLLFLTLITFFSHTWWERFTVTGHTHTCAHAVRRRRRIKTLLKIT